MRRAPIKVKEPEEFYFPLRGGLDLVTPPYQIQPGKMLDCFRYEIASSGGYRPIDGYERVDGHGLPSQAVFQVVPFTSAVAIPEDTIVTGATSGAVGISLMSGLVDVEQTGTPIDLTGTGVFLLRSGEFQADEDILVGGVATATAATTIYTPNVESVDSHEFYYHWKAVEKLRSLVQQVPGSGPIRGVWRFKGTLYAFRDNAGGTACVMWKEDATAGWAVVTTPALAPGGEYRFENINFLGSSATMCMYGVDGQNKAFEFDGTTFTQITTGMADDRPILICEHAKHLFLGFRNGSLQFSPPTAPKGPWTVVIGAGELGMGEELQDAVSLPGGVLGIFCKDSIATLSGTGASSFALADHSKESGAVKGTVQNVGKVVFLNATGLADLQATSAFGNFKAGTLSDNIQPMINKYKALATCSVGVLPKNQYRIFFSDGTVISVTMAKGGAIFSRSYYDIPVRCISAPKRADDELGSIYFGSDDGYVYKMDSGVSLDDKPMEAFFRTAYGHQGSPRQKKRYREVVVELDQNQAGSELVLSFAPDFALTRSDVPLHGIVDVSEKTGVSGVWDISDWNTFSWESSDGSTGGGGTASGRIDGVATEMSLMFYFYAPTTVTPLHVLNGIFVYYNFLGRQR